MQKYELVIIFDPDLDETQIGTELESIDGTIKAHGGSVLHRDIWGKRQLAYPINKKEYGSYVLQIVEGDSTLVAELERQFAINEKVYRNLMVKKDKFAPDYAPRPREDSKRRGDRGGERGGDYAR